MKFNFKYISILSISLILIGSCKKLDLNDVLYGITPISIKYVNGDSTAITANDCINPYNNYLLEISIKVNDANSTTPHSVHYTLNDSAKQIEFIKTGKKYVPVKFVEGFNTVKLDATTLKDTLTTHYQEFELVN